MMAYGIRSVWSFLKMMLSIWPLTMKSWWESWRLLSNWMKYFTWEEVCTVKRFQVLSVAWNTLTSWACLLLWIPQPMMASHKKGRKLSDMCAPWMINAGQIRANMGECVNRTRQIFIVNAKERVMLGHCVIRPFIIDHVWTFPWTIPQPSKWQNHVVGTRIHIWRQISADAGISSWVKAGL